MKIKLTNEQLSKLELHVLDKTETRKTNRLKNKFLHGKSENNFIISHLSDDEYLYLLDKIEDNMCDDISGIYESLIMQDNKDLIKPFEITNTII